VTEGPSRPDWCWSCLRVEPLPDRFYILCIECGHVYRTGWELRREYRRRAPRLAEAWRDSAVDWDPAEGPPWVHVDVPYGVRIVRTVWWWSRLRLRRAKRIFFCPLCIHDF